MGNVIRIDQLSASTWEEVLDLFILYKEAQGRAPRTVGDYRQHVTMFFKRYPEAWGDSLRARKATMAYMSTVKNPNTYNLRYAYLKVFWDWAISEGFHQGTHPLKGLKKKKPQGRVVRIEPDTLRALLNLPDKTTWTGLRDYTLLLLQIDTGIRPGEAIQLYPHDVNVPGREVRIRAEIAKTRTPRTLPMSATTANAMGKLLRVHEKQWAGVGAVPVFCSREGEEILEKTWAYHLRKYSKHLKTNITPYMLRHAAALSFLKNGGDVMSLQRLLGHADLTMTKRYLNIMDDDVKEAHATASPVTNLFPKKRRVHKI